MKYKGRYLVLFSFLIIFGMAACSSDSKPASEEEDSSASTSEGDDSNIESETSGGTLEIAYPTQPQSIDPHTSTAEATRDAGRLIYESLVILNENYEVMPQLAESFKVSDDRKSVSFELREGINFHNGEEMKAEDVVASMTKWGENSIAKSAFGEHEWITTGDYAVELQVSEPSSLIMSFLGDQEQFPAIMPKEIAENAESTGATEYIGTGPFKFVDWKQDEVIHFVKFEDYQPDSEPASGLGGKKEALVDEINWNFVPDSSTRVNGLISGEYDFAHMLSYDSIPQIEASDGSVVDIWPYGNEILVFNKKHGLFKDVKARQAVNAAMDMEVLLSAAFTDKKFYDLEHGLFLPSQTDWYSDSGKELYNQKDVDKAKKLLDEAGYDGEEVVILTSRDYEHHYNAAVATQQQLEKIGINAKLDVYDWPTLLERRDNPEMYDIFFTGFPTTSTPHQYIFLDSSAEWPGWTENDELDRLLNEIKSQESPDEAKALYSELQQVMWEDLPVINVGKNSRVSGYSKKLQGYTELLGPIFWNTSISE